MNDYQLLGNVADSSLREIWQGEKAWELRRAMERDDLSIGCEFCQWQVEDGHRELAFSRWFERFEVEDAEPEWPRQLELAMSNTCNLQCAMCNAEWSSSIRAQRDRLPPLPKVYGSEFFEELSEFLPNLEIVKFLGGEPFLASETLRVMDMLVEQDLSPTVHVTTNGTQWTPRVEQVLDRLPVEVAVSLDAATREVYERIRIGSSWENVQRNLDRFIDRCRGVTVTFCLMRSNWQEFGAFCRQADERGIGCAVNVVTEPATMSLYTLPPGDLAQIVAELEAEDRRLSDSLTLSRATWDGELDKLRRHVQHGREGHTVVGLQVRKLNEDFPRPFAQASQQPKEGGLDSVRVALTELATRYLGPELGRLEISALRRVETIAPPDGVLGIPARDLKGTHVNDLLGLLEPHLGALVQLDVLEATDDALVYEAQFDGGQVVRSLQGPRLDGSGRRPGTTMVLAAVPGS